MRSIHSVLLVIIIALATTARAFAEHMEIPFQQRDGLIWIQVQAANSPAPLTFLVDSGAQVSVLDRTEAQKLHLKTGAKANVLGVGSSTTGYWTELATARAGALRLPREYLVLDLTAFRGNCTNTVINGLLGGDFFRGRIVQIDYQDQVLRILRNVSTTEASEVLPLKVRCCGMLVPIQVNSGKQQRVRLDTGCASPLQWVSGDAPPEGCTERVAVALAPLSLLVTQTDLTLGSLELGGIPTDIHTQEIFPGEKGLLGNGLLSRFRTVTIDARNKRLLLQK